MDPNKIVNSVSSSAGKSTMTPSKVPEASSSLSGINNPLEKKEKVKENLKRKCEGFVSAFQFYKPKPRVSHLVTPLCL